MSSEQASITDFDTAEPDEPDDPTPEVTIETGESSHTCGNCDRHVTSDYVRVFGVDGEVDCCPHCPDLVRSGSEVREARAPRHGKGGDE